MLSSYFDVYIDMQASLTSYTWLLSCHLLKTLDLTNFGKNWFKKAKMFLLGQYGLKSVLLYPTIAYYTPADQTHLLLYSRGGQLLLTSILI